MTNIKHDCRGRCARSGKQTLVISQGYRPVGTEEADPTLIRELNPSTSRDDFQTNSLH